MANEIEAFTIALANMDTAVAQRMLRFTNTFFTVIAASDESPGEPGRFHLTQGSEIAAVALMQEIQGLINPVPPEGNALIQNVEDLQTQTRLKVTRARAAVDDTVELLGGGFVDRHLLARHAQVARSKAQFRHRTDRSVERISGDAAIQRSRRGRGRRGPSTRLPPLSSAANPAREFLQRQLARAGWGHAIADDRQCPHVLGEPGGGRPVAPAA